MTREVGSYITREGGELSFSPRQNVLNDLIKQGGKNDTARVET